MSTTDHQYEVQKAKMQVSLLKTALFNRGFRECQKSKDGFCVYDEADVSHDRCIHCGMSFERK